MEQKEKIKSTYSKNVNIAILMGNVGREPYLQQGDSGTKYCYFSLATNYSYRGKDDALVTRTSWHEVLLSGTVAEKVAPLIHKGSLVHVTGRIVQKKKTYLDPVTKNEVPVNVASLLATSVHVLSNKGEHHHSDSANDQHEVKAPF